MKQIKEATITKTDDKKPYLFKFFRVDEAPFEFRTKPLTSAEFKEIEDDILADSFPIILDGNRREGAGAYSIEWDRFYLDESKMKNPNVYVLWGIYNEKP